MIFTNPIQNVEVQQPTPAPQPGGSTAGDLVQLAQFGTNWMAQRQQRDAQQAQLAAQQQMEQQGFQAESLAVNRLNEAARIRQEKGAVHAQRYLDQAYRSDFGTLRSSNERKAYTDTFKTMFGGSPTDAAQEMELAQERARQERVDSGYELLLGQGFSPEDLQSWTPESLHLVSQMHDGRSAYLSQQSQIASLEAQQMSNQSARDSRAARYAVDAFNAGFSETIQDLRMNLINASTDEEYARKKAEALNTIRNLKGNLRSEVSSAVQGFQLQDSDGNVLGTATAGDVSNSDMEFFGTRIDELERWITGDFAREQNAQQVSLFDSQLELAIRENPSSHAMALLVAGAHGQQVDVNVGSGLFRDLTEQAMDFRSGMRIRVESERMPASQAVLTAPQPSAALRSVFSEWSMLSDVEQSPQERAAAGRMAGEAIAGTFEGNSESRRLANSSNGVLIVHQKLAKDPQYASEVAAGIEEVAQDRGMTVEQMYREELASFTNRTLIPSLRASGNTGGTNLLENVGVRYEGGKIIFDSSPDSQPRTDRATGRVTGNPAPRTAGGMPTGIGRASMQFQANLNRAARDLNTILQSYANVTGVSADQLLQQEAEHLQGWLDGMFGREREEVPAEQPEPQQERRDDFVPRTRMSF